MSGHLEDHRAGGGLAPAAVRPPSRPLPPDRRDMVAALLTRWKDEGWA